VIQRAPDKKQKTSGKETDTGDQNTPSEAGVEPPKLGNYT